MSDESGNDECDELEAVVEGEIEVWVGVEAVVVVEAEVDVVVEVVVGVEVGVGVVVEVVVGVEVGVIFLRGRTGEMNTAFLFEGDRHAGVND